MKTSSISRICLSIFWRQINFQFWKVKLKVLVGLLIVQASAIFLIHRFDQVADLDYMVKGTALMDRPCEKALRNFCPQNDILNCSGEILYIIRNTDNEDKWEVKLQLHQQQVDIRFPVSLLEVYGGTDEACKKLGLGNLPLYRTKWLWPELNSVPDPWSDFVDVIEYGTQSSNDVTVTEKLANSPSS